MMMITYRSLLCLCVMALTIGSRVHMASVSRSADRLPLRSVPTVRQTLNVAIDSIQHYLRVNEQGHRIGEVVAGVIVGVAVQQAIVSLHEQLDVPTTNIPQSTTQTLALVNDAVVGLTNGSTRYRAQASAVAQRITNSLPIDRQVPQVLLINPLIVTRDNDALVLAIHGNFFDLAGASSDASLRFGAGRAVLTNSDKSTTQIGFRIPVGLFHSRPGDDVSYTNATLSIPTRKRCVFGMLTCGGENAMFELIFLTLPPHAGTLTFVWSRHTVGREQQTITGPEIAQESDRDDLANVQHCVAPDPGWRVVPNSVDKIVTWSQGDQGVGRDWWWTNNTSSEQAACWGITTIHHGLGTSGKVHYRLRFEETREIDQSADSSQTVELDWGSVRSFTVRPTATWRAYYSFGGNRTGIDRADSSEPYLRVTTGGEEVTFTTEP